MSSNMQYDSNISRMSAPLRTITVRDAMSNLPDIKNGASARDIKYSGELCCHFQKLVSGGSREFVATIVRPG